MVPNKTALCQFLQRCTSTNVPFMWNPTDTKAFRDIQTPFSEAVLLSFTVFKKPFHVYADASGTQAGGINMQELKIIECYSRALNKHLRNYTTMELELISVVEIIRRAFGCCPYGS